MKIHRIRSSTLPLPSSKMQSHSRLFLSPSFVQKALVVLLSHFTLYHLQQLASHHHHHHRHHRHHHRHHPNNHLGGFTNHLFSNSFGHFFVDAISANPNPTYEYDEYGNKLPPIYLRGDESYHWEEDELGYTIMDDPDYEATNDGAVDGAVNEGMNGEGVVKNAKKRGGVRKVYAKLDPESGELVSSGIVFGSLHPLHSSPSHGGGDDAGPLLSSSSLTVDATIKLAGLEKHIKPSKEMRRKRCGAFCGWHEGDDEGDDEGNDDDGVDGKVDGVDNHTLTNSTTNAEGVSRGLRGTHHPNSHRPPNNHHPANHRNLPLHQRDPQEYQRRRQLISTDSKLKNLVVLIRFADHQNRDLPPPEYYDILMNGPKNISELNNLTANMNETEAASYVENYEALVNSIIPTGSVNDVFLANSYGTFSFESVVYPWITVSQTEAYYADGGSGVTGKLFSAIREALTVIDNDPNITLSSFNTDPSSSLSIDAITIIHSGYGAEWGTTDCNGQKLSDRIWSHYWYMWDMPFLSKDGKLMVREYHINPGLWGTCGNKITRIGVIAHETSHFLGLPDLYDVDDGGVGIGNYDLMANAWGVTGAQRYPPLMSAWSKISMGWMTPSQITATSHPRDYTLRQASDHPDVYSIHTNFHTHEYLLIENRQPTSFDAKLPRGGLAIWHIDELQWENNREGYPSQANWPYNNNHYKVALLQADGRYDLEKGVNFGDYQDLFYKDHYFGMDYLHPSQYSGSENVLDGPWPNTDSYAAKTTFRTGNYVSDISASGEEMTFSYLNSDCDGMGEDQFDLSLFTDGKGHEVSWSLMETYSGVVLLSGDGYGNRTEYHVQHCIPRKCYTFVIYDDGNDGINGTTGSGSGEGSSPGYYTVRINGWNVASGGEFAGAEESVLRCMIPPTESPTLAPIPVPSMTPSSSPTTSFAPTRVCTIGNSLMEIIMEGEEFFTDEISWNVTDVHGNIMLSHNSSDTSIGGGDGNNTDVGHFIVRECIPHDNCYTFSIHDSSFGAGGGDSGGGGGGGDGESVAGHHPRGIYTLKFDGEEIVSGSNFRSDQVTMFGDTCLERSGDIICANYDDNNDATDSSMLMMSAFRLELVADLYGRQLTWKLINNSSSSSSSSQEEEEEGTILHSAGPFGDCNLNTMAMCLPSEDCYKFILMDSEEEAGHNNGGGDGSSSSSSSSSSYGQGLFTVMFTEENDGLIQNYTGPVFGHVKEVFLGSCYDMNDFA